MKIVVNTTYFNVDEKFVNEYIESLCQNEMLKDKKEKFLNGELVSFHSIDDLSDAFGVTSYRLDKSEI